MRHSILLVPLFLILAPLSGAGGQDIASLQHGARIRVTPINGNATVGSLSGIDSDSLRFMPTNSPSRQTSLGLAQVKRVQVSRGRDRARGALTGAAKGFGIGFIAGGLLGAIIDNGSPGDFFYMSQVEQAALVGAVVGVAGVVPGSVYGAVKGSDRWEQVPLRSR